MEKQFANVYLKWSESGPLDCLRSHAVCLWHERMPCLTMISNMTTSTHRHAFDGECNINFKYGV